MPLDPTLVLAVICIVYKEVTLMEVIISVKVYIGPSLSFGVCEFAALLYDEAR